MILGTNIIRAYKEVRSFWEVSFSYSGTICFVLFCLFFYFVGLCLLLLLLLLLLWLFLFCQLEPERIIYSVKRNDVVGTMLKDL